ncbi:MAG: LamG domain-containing protein [Phycisphaerales bacterium]
MNRTSLIRGIIAPALAVAAICTTPAFAQPDRVRDIIKDAADSGNLSPAAQTRAERALESLEEDPRVGAQKLEWERTYIPSAFNGNGEIGIRDFQIDLEGNLISLGSINNTDSGFDGRGYFLTKFNGAVETGTPAEAVWEAARFPEDVSSERIINQQLAVDLDGNCYVLYGVGSDDSFPSAKFFIDKYTPQGVNVWTSQVRDLYDDTDTARIVVDADSNIYVAGVEEKNGALVIERFRPDGVKIWSKNLFSPVANLLGFELDRFGNPHLFYNTNFLGLWAQVSKLDPRGEILWNQLVPQNFSIGAVGPFLDLDCNVYVGLQGFISNDTYMALSYDPTGEVRHFTQFGFLSDDGGSTIIPDLMRGVVDRSGILYLTGSGGSADSEILQFDTAGQLVARNIYRPSFTPSNGSTRVGDIELDRFGNPYISGRATLGGQSGVGFVRKFDRLNIGPLGGPYPPPVWEHDSNPVGQNTSLGTIAVDFGDNIWFGGSDSPDSGNGTDRARLGLLSQPFTDVPSVYENDPRMLIENQSLWGPFVGGVSATQSIFQITRQQTNFTIRQGQTFSVPFFGEFGGFADFNGEMSFGLGFEATASGGIVDISYPGQFDITVPGAAKISAGSPFNIQAVFTPSEEANVTADATPELSAGLVGNLGIGINSFAQGLAFSDPIATLDLINLDANWSGLIPGLSLQLPTGSPGSWLDFGDERNLVSGRLKRPLFTSNGGIDPSNGDIKSELEPEVFFSLRGNMTNFISTYQFGTPTIFSISSGTSSAWSLGANVNVAQAFAEIGLEANQALKFVPDVSVIYDFVPNADIYATDGSGLIASNVPSWEVPMTKVGGVWNTTVRVAVPGSRLAATNSTFLVTPRSKITSELQNRTWVDIQPKVGWETLAAGASATAAGFDLFSFEFCALCFDIPLSGDIPINLYDNAFDLPDTVASLDPIVISIDPDGQPQVAGTSRARLNAFIYDQVDADPFELAAFINQSPKRMLIYGDKFFTKGKYPIDDFVICVGGRIMNLNAQILNSRTALVEIPNEARLIPAVARIWPVDAAGVPLGESVDFSIELPAPNLGTVGPNLWAGDPRISNIAIDAIDGLTPAGTPSYVARRDYWVVLSDMWDSIGANNGVSLANSYPLFDFTGEPPIPTVLIERDEVPTIADRAHAWRFDPGTNYADDAGSADASPSGSPPPISTDGVPSFLDGAAEFAGQSLVIDPASLTPPGDGDYTIAAWVKRDVISPSFQVVLDANNSGGFSVLYRDNRPSLTLSSGVSEVFTASGGITNTQWHHIAVTVDRDQTDGLRWYINGELDSTFDPTGVPGFVPNGLVPTIGVQDNGTSSPLNGKIGDLLIVNRSLDSEEVSRLANQRGETPIPRFRQPVENGILYSLMPVSDYDEPGFKTIRLASPGPGGGYSNAVELTVAAPQPVTQRISPPSRVPGGGDFELIVTGPLSVPYFQGFEEERFGNYNKASTVHWNGLPLVTKFVSPGELRAIVPADLTASSGTGTITVETPGNGTGYFDSFSGNLINSGGTSNPQIITIRYPIPEIDVLSPNLTSRAVIDRCVDNPQMLKIQVVGRGFWPGSTIWFDGNPLETFVQTTKERSTVAMGILEEELTFNVLFAYLSVDDLGRVYSAPITVSNPEGVRSNTVNLEIVDRTTYEAFYGVTLPDQTLPGEPCDK